jgi:hypothetical protein
MVGQFLQEKLGAIPPRLTRVSSGDPRRGAIRAQLRRLTLDNVLQKLDL